MMSTNKKIGRNFYLIVLPLIVVLALALVIFLGYITEYRARNQAISQLENTLAFQLEILQSVMDKYAVMTALIARRKDIVTTLDTYQIDDSASQSTPIVLDVNYLTNIVSGMSGASDIWVINTSGRIIVTNNLIDKDVYITDQPYFSAALEGRLGRASQYDDEGRRFYIFAAPVFYQSEIKGVVAVRLNLEFIEQFWALVETPILVTDVNQRIFLSNQTQWRLVSFNDVVVSASSRDAAGITMLANQFSQENNSKFLLVSRHIPLLNWNLSLMGSYTSVQSQRNTIQFISLLVIGFLILSLCFWVERWRRLMKEQRLQQAFALRLERQVKDRTKALTEANKHLHNEIAERKIIEQDLREAQEDLVQAAKLAGIGQMSTALAHEYNQPLAAIHSYADNAVAFLDKGQSEDAQDNLQRIKLLINKMAVLTKTLRNFAYKSNDQQETIPIAELIDEITILLSPQAKKLNINLIFSGEPEPIYILGDKGRLSQVIVNLVVNAMDAVELAEQKQVTVNWHRENDDCVIFIEDTGPGISADIQENIFTPFFTTKVSGSGLGLGLFIVSNIIKGYKGTIELNSEDNKGTLFIIRLPCVDKM